MAECLFARGQDKRVICCEVAVYKRAEEGTVGYQHYQDSCLGGGKCATRISLERALETKTAEVTRR